MKFDLSKIEMSRMDINRGITLPKKLDTKLAEFIGILVGDGHLGYYPGFSTEGYRIIRSDLKIAGNKDEEQYLDYIRNLFYSLFNIHMSYAPDSRSKGIILLVNSKVITLYLNKICGIPLNRKTEIIGVPEIIKKSSKNIKYAFLRGLADTDFSVTFRHRAGKGHIYPCIKSNFKSKQLVRDLEILFKEFKFSYCTCYNLKRYDKRFGLTIINGIYLNGIKNFEKWINKIGFSNSKFVRKIEKWKKEGVCPPGY